MRSKRTLIALTVTSVVVTAAPANAASSRPTAQEARSATRTVLGSHAELLDGHLTISACHAIHRHSRVCRARIDGPSPERYRVTVTVAGESLVIRARAT